MRSFAARGRRPRVQALPLSRSCWPACARVLRRAEGRRGAGVLRVGELTVDPLTRAVGWRDGAVELSAKEFALLRALAEDPTRVYGKHELLRDVWGYRSIGQHAHPGRARLPAAEEAARGSAREWVLNVRGVGYKLTEAL